MSIELLGITALGDNQYRLDFQDEGASVSFVLERLPRKGVVISREFDRHFRGRTSGQDAVMALGSFARGEPVSFPVQVRKDGFTGMGS
jgi:hypothetical protein